MKKSKIKNLLIAVAIATTTNISFAQTPYDSFVKSEEQKPMLKLQSSTFRAFNTDTTSDVKYIELDKEIYTISYFNENDSLIKTHQLEPTAMKWWVVDPKSGEREWVSPYNFVQNNPINRIDPTGELDDWVENADGGIYWDNNATSQSSTKAGERYLGKAVVTFEGSRNEKLGQGQNLFGEGAVLANVTVYGPDGANDIEHYQGFTMSSNFEKYGAIDDGEYTVNYRNPGKRGALKSNWAVENTRPVNALDGVNPSPVYPYSATQKDGIYIHRSNRNGWAGGQVSTGCLLVVPTQYDIKGNATNMGYDQFNRQLSGVNEFKLILSGRRK